MWQPLLPFTFDAVGWSGSGWPKKQYAQHTASHNNIDNIAIHIHKWTSRVSDMRRSSLHIVDELIRPPTTLALPDKKEFRFYRHPEKKKRRRKTRSFTENIFLSLKAEEIF